MKGIFLVLLTVRMQNVHLPKLQEELPNTVSVPTANTLNWHEEASQYSICTYSRHTEQTWGSFPIQYLYLQLTHWTDTRKLPNTVSVPTANTLNRHEEASQYSILTNWHTEQTWGSFPVQYMYLQLTHWTDTRKLPNTVSVPTAYTLNWHEEASQYNICIYS